MSNRHSSPEPPSTANSTEKFDLPGRTSRNDRAQFPDGGLAAWGVVLGGFLAQCSTWGIIMSFGVFKKEYTTTLLSNSSTPAISAIGSLQLFIGYGLGPLVGRLFDAYGSRILNPLGSCITVLSIILVSFCHENQPYQFFLTHGVLFGIGCSILNTPSSAIINQWFYRKRPLALGIVSSGGALGGTIFPLVLPQLISKLGFPWAIRILAAIIAVFLGITCVIARTRLPPSGGMTWRSAVDFSGFRDSRYSLACSASFLMSYAMFIPYFFIDDYAKLNGVKHDVAKLLVTITSACSAISRILPGIIANRFGALDVLIPTTWTCATLVLGMWLPSHKPIPIAIFGGLYGFFSGPFNSLIKAYIACISPQESFGARLGTLDLFIAIATLIGPPTQGALIKPLSHDHFKHLIIFTGLTIVASGVVLAITRIVDYKHTCKEMRHWL
ncbi:hypothetical protein HGRIS_005162 [Hohenbuehelia grisea]|uniref:Major facilitator superfamily (MFS) profile domain-containing protein n=1 Tax=Hohenbuehelia grisea TaxID=104357 RepID=A0ABR3JE49_9AGAR